MSVLHAIVGTAGHIDHGKTRLVRALTGYDTDRLKEEKERGISIDLGFAPLDVDGRRVGVVDVPGHERFIRNMLAGAHAVDLVLLTVAADDGVMPQTIEHVDLLHLLGVSHGVAVITKADLVGAEHIAEVRRDVERLLATTRLHGLPVVAVSASTGAGLAELRARIAEQLRAVERRSPHGRFRMPVDRAFHVRGHGTVVTGTAVAGTIAVGDEVRILPGGELVRVRGIQVHDAPVESAGWHQRVALNLVGAEHAHVARGHVVVDPCLRLTTDRVDASIELCPSARDGIASHTRVRVHLGTAETMAKLVLLDRPVLEPAGRALAQLALEARIVAFRGDRFIVRAENGRRTLGGGVVLAPVAGRRTRRDAEERLASLRLLRDGTPRDAVTATLALAPEWGLSPAAIAERLDLPEEELRRAAAGSVLVFLAATSAETWMAPERWQRLCARVRALVGEFHGAHPLLGGVDMETLRTHLGGALDPRLFRALVERLVAGGLVVRRDSLLALPGHRVALAAADQALAERVATVLDRARHAPPEVRFLQTELGAPARALTDVLQVLERAGAVVRVTSELHFGAAAVSEARGVLERAIRERGSITAAEFRDLLGVSRKFSIALLQYFDRIGVTVRVGDSRKLRHE